MGTTTSIITKHEIYDKFRDFAGKADNSICFVFGAGASYGYTETQNKFYLPPTVEQLFDEGKNATVN